MQGLRIRKLADRTKPRPERFEGDTSGPWALAGIQFVGDPPKRARVSTTFIADGERQGWLSLVNRRREHRPGGPADQPWKVTHTFMHAEAIIFHTVDGQVRYRVTHQPDKYVADGKDTDQVTDKIYESGETRIDWFYDLEKE